MPISNEKVRLKEKGFMIRYQPVLYGFNAHQGKNKYELNYKNK